MREVIRGRQKVKNTGCIQLWCILEAIILPVIGFNSGKYDVNVIKPNLDKYFVNRAEWLTLEDHGDDDGLEDAVKPQEQRVFKYVV